MEQATPTSGPWLRVIPPVQALFLALAAWGVQEALGCGRLVPYPWRLAALVPGAAGVGVGVWGLRAFRHRKTTYEPFGRPSALVAAGPFRFTRNPMYLGVTSFLLGLALFVGTAPFFAVPVVFMLLMNFIQIPHEERLLAGLFGEEWDAYRRQVRRWL